MWRATHLITSLPRSRANAACRITPLSLAATFLIQGRSLTTRQQHEFLSWMRRRGENKVCPAVTIGNYEFGRGLFASRSIKKEERILRFSQNLVITPENLHPEVKCLLQTDVKNHARLALVLLAEQHAGEASEWAPYISCLPQIGTLHNTYLWNDEDIEMLQESASAYRKVLEFKASILEEFAAVQHVLQRCPHLFGHNVTYARFLHAYALVSTRGWSLDEHGAVGLVPFADFLNHDANCESCLSIDPEYQHFEIFTDRNYAAGEQVFVSYGEVSNEILSLNYGFTLPYNPYDQVQVLMSLSQRDALRNEKLQLLQSHGMPAFSVQGDHSSGENTFFIKEANPSVGRSSGIPQSLFAFARVLSANSREELADLAKEAAQYDGWLAQTPLRNKRREHQAMVLLLRRLEDLVQDHTSAIVALEMTEYRRTTKTVSSVHREMAAAILQGELRVLRSAAKWLNHHCKKLSALH